MRRVAFFAAALTATLLTLCFLVLPVIAIGGRAFHLADPVTSGPREAEIGPGHKDASRAIPSLGALLQVLDTPAGETP